jgi:hypothetical protein
MFLFAPPATPELVFAPAIDIRSRFERRTDRDFDKAVDDNRSDVYSRGRFIINAKYGDNVTGKLQYRYALDDIFTVARCYSDDRNDVDLAWLKLGQGDGATTLGRQEVVKGDGRMLGTAEFTQIAMVYDGARFTNKKWDFFAGKLEIEKYMYPDLWLGMASHTTGLGETMFLAEQAAAPVNDLEVYTLDHRDVSSRGKWTGTIEAAYQIGRNETKAITAWGVHSRMDYRIHPKWTLYCEGNVATGGSSATQSHDFDTFQYMAGNHRWYGQMDMQGWENMKHLEFGVDYAPDNRLSVGLQWHAFELYDAKDAWYGYAGAINTGAGGASFQDPTGLSGKDLGQEIDLTGTYKLDKNLELQYGLAEFLPGGFVKAFSGSNTCNQFWCYFGITGKY